MAKKDRKVIKLGANPAPSKTPKTEAFPDFNQLRPAWRIGSLVMQEPFGWHVIDNIKFEEIRRRLSELEKLTWGEILVQQKRWNHTVQTEKLCKEAKDQLIEMRMDDLDEIVSLRLSNLERVWGVRLEGAMTLLWWDPDHSVYPTHPRH